MPHKDPKPAKTPPDMIARPLDEVRELRGERVVAVGRSKIAALKAFRRMHVDRVVGVLGVVGIVLATSLLFVWEKPPVVEPSWPVQWTVTEETMLDEAGTLQDPASGGAGGPAPVSSQTFTFDVTHDNVTNVAISLSFIDDVAQGEFGGDTFRLTVQGPQGSNFTRSKEGQANATATFFVNMTASMGPIPSLQSAPVKTEAEARSYTLSDSPPHQRGQGTWTVTVDLITVRDAWSDTTADPQQQRCTPAHASAGLCRPDTGNAFSLSSSYRWYEAAFPAPAA